MGEKRCGVIMVTRAVLLEASRVPCRGGFTTSEGQAEISGTPES